MRTLIDSYKHKGWRKAMVAELSTLGIQNQNVLDALNQVPRHFLLDPVFDHIAYQNRSIPIGQNQTISQPFTVAFQTELLQVSKYDKILEIGTGSGYQSAILAQLGANVFTIERQKELFDQFQASNPFVTQYKRIKYFYGDGFKGLASFAPFDKIIITCGAPLIPPALLQQLKVGGIMVIPQNEGDQQRMKRITKISSSENHTEEFGNFLFVPMLQGKQQSK